MKTKFALIFFFVLIVLSSVSVKASEVLEGWNESIDTGVMQFIPNGTTMDITVSGDGEEAWGNHNKYFDGAYGVMATFNVSSVFEKGLDTGLRMYVGLNSIGNKILAEIRLSEYDGEHRITYRLRERLSDGTTVKVIAYGFLGNYKGMWDIGQNITIGFAHIGKDIYFYTPETNAYVKIEPFFDMFPMDSSIEIYGWAETGCIFSATVSNVNILK
jgi:hypothetical protein